MCKVSAQGAVGEKRIETERRAIGWGGVVFEHERRAIGWGGVVLETERRAMGGMALCLNERRTIGWRGVCHTFFALQRLTLAGK
jgi:hypothetical protein